MAEGRSNHAIGHRLFVSDKTVEAHVRSVFTKLDLMPGAGDHRRVLAVLAFLRSFPDSSDPEQTDRGEGPGGERGVVVRG